MPDKFDRDVLAGARNCSDVMLHMLHARMGCQDIDMRPSSKDLSVLGRCMRFYTARYCAEELLRDQITTAFVELWGSCKLLAYSTNGGKHSSRHVTATMPFQRTLWCL